jgi:hypothetical protein
MQLCVEKIVIENRYFLEVYFELADGENLRAVLQSTITHVVFYWVDNIPKAHSYTIDDVSTNPRNYFYSNKQFANPKLILIDFCLHMTKVDKNNQKTIAINYLFMKINQKIISQFLQLQNNLSFQIVFWLFCH